MFERHPTGLGHIVELKLHAAVDKICIQYNTLMTGKLPADNGDPLPDSHGGSPVSTGIALTCLIGGEHVGQGLAAGFAFLLIQIAEIVRQIDRLFWGGFL